MVHVLDASRVVNVVSVVALRRSRNPAFMADVVAKQDAAARGVRRRGGQRKRPLLSLADGAFSGSPVFDWATGGYSASPEFLGARKVYDPVPLEEIVPFIDWASVLSGAWELHGPLPRRFWRMRSSVLKRPEAVCNDGQKLCSRRSCGNEKRFTAKAVIGYWPCNSVGDDIEIYSDDEARRKVLTRFPPAASAARESRTISIQPLSRGTTSRRSDSGRIDYMRRLSR